jgi:hypothetical protein
MDHFTCPGCGISVNAEIARSEYCPGCWRRDGRRVRMSRRPAPLRSLLATGLAPVREQLRAMPRKGRPLP